MTRHRLLAALSLALAACSTGPSSVGARFNGPSAVVTFAGVTRKNPPTQGSSGVRTYLAVASTRGDELRLLDPADEQPVLGPGVVFPLSVATAPRPLLLAAAPLGDSGADALVAVSAGDPALQVVDTWDTSNRVAYRVELGPQPDGTAGVLPAGSQILAVAGLPGGRIVVAASGGLLVAVGFARGTAGDVVLVPPGLFTAAAAASVSAPLGFDAADLAVDPDGATVYAATGDRIGAVFGVGKIVTNPGAPSTWAVTPIDTRGPTTAVAAGLVDERVVSSSDPCSADTFASSGAGGGAARVRRVYAALDPVGCGPDQPIDCGVVTIDPAAGAGAGALAADPAGLVTVPAGATASPVPAQGYLAPMPVPGVVDHLALGHAPATPPDATSDLFTLDTSVPNATCGASADPTSGRVSDPKSSDVNRRPFKIAPGTGQRYTTAVLMATSSDGNVYLLDVARWGPPSDIAVLTGTSALRVVTAASGAVPGNKPQLGLWSVLAPFGTAQSGFTPQVVTDATTLPSLIEIWPGFTDAATWSLVWQGILPGLATRQGILFTPDGGATTYAAFQSDSGQRDGAKTVWTVNAAAGDPALGIQAGDILQFPSVSTSCDWPVQQVLAKGDPALTALAIDFPGGALRLGTPSDTTCPAGSASGAATILTLRSGGLVLSNDRSGHLGRPQIAAAAPAGTDVDGTYFSLSWQDEAPIADPAKLALVRKARRRFYSADGPCPVPGAAAGTQGALAVGCYTGFPRLYDPLAPGPAVRFRVGLVPAAAPLDPVDAATPPRDSGIFFTTQGGLVQTSRHPISAGELPRGIVTFDPSTLRNLDGTLARPNDQVRFYVPYIDDLLMRFSASSTAADVATIR